MQQIQPEVDISQEEIARMEITNFVNEGIKEIKEGNLYNIDEVFDDLEARYTNVKL
jgi:hypothetical protein